MCDTPECIARARSEAERGCWLPSGAMRWQRLIVDQRIRQPMRREFAKALIGGILLTVGLYAWLVLIILVTPGPR